MTGRGHIGQTGEPARRCRFRDHRNGCGHLQQWCSLADERYSHSGDGEDEAPGHPKSPAICWYIKWYIYFNPSLNNWQSTLTNADIMAERAGFEPAIPIRYTGFRGRRIRPLCHLSVPDNQHIRVALPLQDAQRAIAETFETNGFNGVACPCADGYSETPC